MKIKFIVMFDLLPHCDTISIPIIKNDLVSNSNVLNLQRVKQIIFFSFFNNLYFIPEELYNKTNFQIY